MDVRAEAETFVIVNCYVCDVSGITGGARELEGKRVRKWQVASAVM